MKCPTHGPARTANELRLAGVTIGSSGVRGVWLRHGIETRHKRLLRLETASRENLIQLTEEQIALLERVSPEFRSRHVESSKPGELLNQDTFY